MRDFVYFLGDKESEREGERETERKREKMRERKREREWKVERGKGRGGGRGRERVIEVGRRGQRRDRHRVKGVKERETETNFVLIFLLLFLQSYRLQGQHTPRALQTILTQDHRSPKPHPLMTHPKTLSLQAHTLHLHPTIPKHLKQKRMD